MANEITKVLIPQTSMKQDSKNPAKMNQIVENKGVGKLIQEGRALALNILNKWEHKMQIASGNSYTHLAWLRSQPAPLDSP